MICVSESDYKIIQEIIARYAANCEVRAFGSRYKWTSNDYSDLDLAFAGDKKLSLAEIGKIREAFEESDLPFRVDVLDLSAISKEFQAIIDQGYEVIYSPPKGATKGWQKVRLGDVVSVLSDGIHGTPSYDDAGDYYFINGNNLSEGKIEIKKDTKRISLKEYIKYKKNLSDRTILVSINGTLGNYALYNNEKCILGKSACYFNVKTDVNKQFIKYTIMSNDFRMYMEKYANGTVIKNVSLKVMREYPFCLPPLPTQCGIAATLSCLDDKIELNNRINANLEAQAQAIFKSWFVDFEPFQKGEFVDSELGKIPKGWRVGTLDECIDFFNGYAFESSKLLDKEENDCYCVFKMGHIKKGGGLNTGGTKSWVRKKDFAELSKYVLRYGDILMCMTDMKSNVALLGHTAVIYEKDKYIVNQRVGLLRINNEVGIDFPYIYILTNHSDFLEDLRKRANSGVQVNLSTTEIKKSKVIIASNKINNDFNNIVKPLFDFIYHNELENTYLKIIRDTLLPRLMSGEIDVGGIE